jgi:23S rRNA (guanine2445-N2)-methyltransferase / 23S rRNA (guanine2069-N7)-methyltransferase
MEYLLENELRGLSFAVSHVNPQGVYGEATLEMIYRVCLWSRLASRVQLIITQGPAANRHELYTTCVGVDWQTFFNVTHSLAVVFHGESEAFRHSLFGAQVVKDAVVDYFREKTQARPNIERVRPDVLLHAHLKHDTITLSMDLIGYSLHQRGYRLQTGLAPLKEHVAAAMLVRARWPERAQEGYAFQDPCCGSGTLVIEAALMAANIAPGLLRRDQAVVHWLGHDTALWEQVRAEATLQQRECQVPLVGSDADANLLDLAQANAERAGVAQWITWQARPMTQARPTLDHGVVVTNPPYGVRLGEEADLIPLYRQLGEVLHTHYTGWQAAILTPSVLLAKSIGLRAHKQYTLYNGAIACKLYCFVLEASNQYNSAALPPVTTETTVVDEGAEMFANRLRKNHATRRKWATRQGIDAYRLYDADLPEYAFAVDVYADYVVVQEYMPPATIDASKAEARRQAALAVIPHVLALPPAHVIMKQRKPQKGLQQYEKLAQQQHRLIVREGAARFNVNLTDYLDTGLFLDHRLLRQQFAKLTSGTRFLNCFCYTATASVHAALAGAFTVNVDLSNTYLTWAEDNFKLNQLDVSRHQFVQYDCFEWLNLTRDQFDVIFLDPPSFSNSKRMQTTLDIQRDHEQLIASARRLLAPGGILYFSTNLRQFKLAQSLQDDPGVSNITPSTIDIDFQRNPRIHYCFKIVN